MANYLIRRLLLLPLTLFAILLVNFTILNLAPGDPATVSNAISADGSRQADQSFVGDDQYLLFREHYGLTLPILINLWPNKLRLDKVTTLAEGRNTLTAKSYSELKRLLGDQARYNMPQLLAIAGDQNLPEKTRQTALQLFVRGGTQFGFTGPGLTPDQRAFNRRVSHDNRWLRQTATLPFAQSLPALHNWYQSVASEYRYEPTIAERFSIFFSETRLFRYLSRVLTLDFGTLRNDPNRRVISEVGSRIRISLTLAVLPMVLAFALCQALGMTMAIFHGRWPDTLLNVTLLIAYAAPVFVVAPFLIERIALPHGLPISGFHSPDETYSTLTSGKRLLDISLHIFLPLIAVMYGTLAAQARLARTAILEVLRQPFITAARAKGVGPSALLFKHVGRNAAITIVTSLAASLGVVLSGSLIVETIFGIDGFGRFFYEAIVNRDYNVILFSGLAGAALALVGYLAADIAYTFLDPRVTLE